MKADFLFWITVIIFEIGKESIAFLQPFFKISDTSGNYEDVIYRGNQFIALQGEELSIFENVTFISKKKIPPGVRVLNLDRLDNILFSSDNQMGIYILENDEIIWKAPPETYNFRGNHFEFDENNTIYTATDKGICYAKLTDKNFKPLTNLSSFDNVTHIAKNRDDTIYFVHNSEKTSWVVNGNTEQVMFQSSIIKSVYYVKDTTSDYKNCLYFLDKNCTLKSVSTFLFDINSPKVTKVMDFEKCDEKRKFMFSYKDKFRTLNVFIFHKDETFDITRGLEKMSVSAKLDGVIINAGAMNDAYFMLATSDGLWAYKWYSNKTDKD